MTFTCPEHLFSHYGHNISRKRHMEWRMTTATPMVCKAPNIAGTMLATDGILIALIEHGKDRLYLGHLASFDDASKETFNLTTRKTSPNRVREANESNLHTNFNKLLENYKL